MMPLKNNSFALAIVVNIGALTPLNAADVTGSWVLQSIEGESVASGGAAPHFEINGDQISGYDGCNTFGGSMGPPAMINSTQRACAPGTFVSLPLDLNDPKAHLAEGTLEGDTLTLPARSKIPASVFVRK